MTSLSLLLSSLKGFPGGSAGKESARNAGELDWKDPLEKEMATHSSVLAWESPWTEGPGRLRSMGLQRVGYDSAHTHTHTHTGSV